MSELWRAFISQRFLLQAPNDEWHQCTKPLAIVFGARIAPSNGSAHELVIITCE